MIEVKGLSKVFRRRQKKARGQVQKEPAGSGKSFYALQDVSFRVANGTILGLLGPNGAGKTTLLRILSTSIRPSAGTACFEGLDILESPLEVRRKVGFLSDNTGLYGRLTAREMIEYFGRLHGMEAGNLRRRVNELINVLDMSAFADKRNDALSSGMKQKVSLARTLVHDPQYIIVDEPTTGLDVAAAEAILQFIESCRANGKTVLFCTHHMHEVERLCDAVVILHQGRLCFEGTVEQMRTRSSEAHLDKAFLRLIAGGEVGNVA
ncbi:MAG TPA: ATP-binding cassette domain-containing protein [Sedimentisphaerales bacterium]|nr:ATP-binding cassette domain-containing protein [Sedimentisphaerales bacterium]